MSDDWLMERAEQRVDEMLTGLELRDTSLIRQLMIVAYLRGGVDTVANFRANMAAVEAMIKNNMSNLKH